MTAAYGGYTNGQTVTLSDQDEINIVGRGVAVYANYPATQKAELAINPVTGTVDGLVGPQGGIPFPANYLPRVASIHDVSLAEPLHELTLPSPYGPETATAGGKYEFAYGTPVYSAKGFNGYKFWMVGAPYPTQGVAPALSAYKYENPCVMASNDGENFEVPRGLTNPIATSIGNADVNSYYADPYIAFNADYTKLYVCFMHTNRSGTVKSSLMVTESSDGVTWSTPVAIYESGVTTFTANSPSLFWNGNGWTCISIDTRDGTGAYTPKIMTTSAATPYTGWSVWSNSTWPHPLGRAWWHAHFIPLAGGEIIGMAVDNGSGGGAIHTLRSNDGGVNFSVKAFSAWRSTVGGSWYRPSVCVASDGVNTSVIGYFGRIGPAQQAGYYIQKARLESGATNRALANAQLEDMIHRQVTVPSGILTNALAAWDSFNRVDDTTGLGTADSGHVWGAETGTMGIGTNRAYNTTASGGNSIATLDPGLQNFEFTAQIETLGGSNCFIVFNVQNSSNFWRFGWDGAQAKFQKIVGGSFALNNTPIVTVAAGDRLTVRREGPYITYFLNGRPIDTYKDATYAQFTKLGLQSTGTASYFQQIYVKAI